MTLYFYDQKSRSQRQKQEAPPLFLINADGILKFAGLQVRLKGLYMDGLQQLCMPAEDHGSALTLHTHIENVNMVNARPGFTCFTMSMPSR